MISTVLVIEEYLKEKLPEGYTVRVLKSQGGNLPNRAPWIRKTYRQTTLDEFMEGSGYGNAPENPHDIEIYYTIHPRWLKEEMVLELLDALTKDMDAYVNSRR